MPLFHMKFQNIPSLILFTLTDDPEFYGLELSLNNILMVGLFRSNNRMVIFSKTEKSHITTNTKGTTHLWRQHKSRVGWGVGGGGDLKICQVFAYAYFFIFKQKIFCSFLQIEGVGVHTIGHINGLNILKLQPIELLETVVSS